MLLLIWLLVWLVAGTPALVTWNVWLVALIACAVLTLFARR